MGSFVCVCVGPRFPPYMDQPTQHSSLRLVSLLSNVFCQRHVFFSNAAALVGVNKVHIVWQARSRGNLEGVKKNSKQNDIGQGRWVGDWGNWRRLKSGCQRCQGWARGSVGIPRRLYGIQPLWCVVYQVFWEWWTRPIYVEPFIGPFPDINSMPRQVPRPTSSSKWVGETDFSMPCHARKTPHPARSKSNIVFTPIPSSPSLPITSPFAFFILTIINPVGSVLDSCISTRRQ